MDVHELYLRTRGHSDYIDTYTHTHTPKQEEVIARRE